MDFSAGTIRNLTQSTVFAVPPTPSILAEIVARGGAEAALRSWLDEHPDLARERS